MNESNRGISDRTAIETLDRMFSTKDDLKKTEVPSIYTIDKTNLLTVYKLINVVGGTEKFQSRFKKKCERYGIAFSTECGSSSAMLSKDDINICVNINELMMTNIISSENDESLIPYWWVAMFVCRNWISNDSSKRFFNCVNTLGGYPDHYEVHKSLMSIPTIRTKAIADANEIVSILTHLDDRAFDNVRNVVHAGLYGINEFLTRTYNHASDYATPNVCSDIRTHINYGLLVCHFEYEIFFHWTLNKNGITLARMGKNPHDYVIIFSSISPDFRKEKIQWVEKAPVKVLRGLWLE